MKGSAYHNHHISIIPICSTWNKTYDPFNCRSVMMPISSLLSLPPFPRNVWQSFFQKFHNVLIHRRKLYQKCVMPLRTVNGCKPSIRNELCKFLLFSISKQTI